MADEFNIDLAVLGAPALYLEYFRHFEFFRHLQHLLAFYEIKH